jgi:sugar O-acyltransferase (sialic acid O-acetyltransferase NeuD family)
MLDDAVAILGFQDGTAGQVASWFEAATGYRIACFVQDASPPWSVDVDAQNAKRVTKRVEYPSADAFKGRPFIVSHDWADKLNEMKVTKVLPLTPDNATRLRQLEVCRARGFELVSAIHPSVRILDGATIDPGVWINAGALIGYKSEIGAGVSINSGVQIDHHNVIERCCQLDPGVVTAGYVTLRECSQVHTAAVIVNRIEIGKGSIIGAGAVVLENIPAACTAVGIPAKVIKHHSM